SSSAVNTTTCNGQAYTYHELAGYGYTASNSRDNYGDTAGGIGSSAAIEKGSWSYNGSSYTGTLWALPDRGWNTEGTLNYNPRVHKYSIVFTPQPNATVDDPASPNLQLTYLDSILFSDPNSVPCTGLDADATGHVSYPGFPDMPVATYKGDGFGGAGTGGERVPVDSEGLVLNDDGSFWVSDEYGPYVYKFSSTGVMLAAIRPPNAFIPRRNDSDSFSADSPPIYNQDYEVDPSDPDSGRQNNQGFEGLTASPDGENLYFLIQSALEQEGGAKKSTRRYARLVHYNITSSTQTYAAEYVVPLPLYTDADDDTRVAAQSEIHYLSPTQFLVLAHDNNVGAGQDDTESVYRHADIFDISSATNVADQDSDADDYDGKIASKKGNLHDDITPAEYCSFLDYNVNSQLERFGVHNGGDQDSGLLNEKWESLALAEVNPGEGDGEYFLFSLSDNDFITQDGYMDGGNFTYADESGYDLLNQVLVFRVTLP
ncbi:3-phytase, partial [Saccharata proteae CBS 121410]